MDIESLSENRSCCKLPIDSGIECPQRPYGNWFQPQSIKELMHILKSFSIDSSYKLIAGNTASGEINIDSIMDPFIR